MFQGFCRKLLCTDFTEKCHSFVKRDSLLHQISPYQFRYKTIQKPEGKIGLPCSQCAQSFLERSFWCKRVSFSEGFQNNIWSSKNLYQATYLCFCFYVLILSHSLETKQVEDVFFRLFSRTEVRIPVRSWDSFPFKQRSEW